MREARGAFQTTRTMAGSIYSCADAGPMALNFAEGCAVVVIERRLYVLGGNDHNMPLNTVEYYDVDIDEWADVAPMAEPRHGLVAVALPSRGHIMAIGGWDGNRLLCTTEIFDVTTGRWTAGPPMNEGRMYHAAAAV